MGKREVTEGAGRGGVGDCMDPMVLHCLEGPWRQPAEQEGTDLVEVKSPRTREPFLRGCPAHQSLEGQQPSRLVASGPRAEGRLLGSAGSDGLCWNSGKRPPLLASALLPGPEHLPHKGDSHLHHPPPNAHQGNQGSPWGCGGLSQEQDSQPKLSLLLHLSSTALTLRQAPSESLGDLIARQVLSQHPFHR